MTITKIITTLLYGTLLTTSCSFQPKAEWVSSTENVLWTKQADILSIPFNENSLQPDLIIDPSQTEQEITGFGACFNELGWLALSNLDPNVRENIMEELFFPELGANFNICRMPIGANDFSRDWYSYNETNGDFEMNFFTVANDQQTLIPFIKNAQKYNSDLRIWASPWSPPSWMKHNKHYACAYTGESYNEKYRNGLSPDSVGHEGTDLFIQEEAYLKAYALYFSKFIDAYKALGIDLFAVMPQNEFNSCQIFPSCTWTAASLANFIGNYLGPEMERKGIDILFGTVERTNELLVDTLLTNPCSSKYIKGVGFQWAGKDAIAGIHNKYPDLQLYQTEQECGDGKNNWEGAIYSWNLMRHYLDNGASAYMYWNMALEKGGISRWGWAQNSLVVVDPELKSFNYTAEYYVLKHVSHYVQPGAYKLKLNGVYKNALAFVNPDDEIVLAIANEYKEEKVLNIQLSDKLYTVTLKPFSVNTLFFK